MCVGGVQLQNWKCLDLQVSPPCKKSKISCEMTMLTVHVCWRQLIFLFESLALSRKLNSTFCQWMVDRKVKRWSNRKQKSFTMEPAHPFSAVPTSWFLHTAEHKVAPVCVMQSQSVAKSVDRAPLPHFQNKDLGSGVSLCLWHSMRKHLQGLGSGAPVSTWKLQENFSSCDPAPHLQNWDSGSGLTWSLAAKVATSQGLKLQSTSWDFGSGAPVGM